MTIFIISKVLREILLAIIISDDLLRFSFKMKWIEHLKCKLKRMQRKYCIVLNIFSSYYTHKKLRFEIFLDYLGFFKWVYHCLVYHNTVV